MLRLARAHDTWSVAFPSPKLAARATLPGAFGYDLAAHSFRVARARGCSTHELLAAALPCSWMVNSRATSPVYKRWLSAPLRAAWDTLVALTSGGPDAWLAHDESARITAREAVTQLAIDGHGVAAVSKVLALVCPESVPLMDDAALWFALDAIARPESADNPRAGAEHFVPMMDWFCRATTANHDALVAVARDYKHATLDAAQVLDRIVWFESWGFRIGYNAARADAPRWLWLADGSREAIVAVSPPLPARPLDARIDVTSESEPFRGAARRALDAGLE